MQKVDRSFPKTVFVALVCLGFGYIFGTLSSSRNSSNDIFQNIEKSKIDRMQREQSHRISELQAQLEIVKPVPAPVQEAPKSLNDSILNANRPNPKYSLLPESAKRDFQSSVWCHGTNRSNRICRFKNLCYMPSTRSYVFARGPMSTIQNVPKEHAGDLLELSTLEDHNVFFFDYTELHQKEFQNYNIRIVPGLSYLFSRFHVGNIMHTLHDDFIGLYHVMKQFSPPNHQSKIWDSTSAPFSLNHTLVFAEGHHEYDYGKIFKLLTDNGLLFFPMFDDPNFVTCFQDIVVGNSKVGNWYQYGFGIPQGPLQNKTVNGMHVREVTQFIKHRIGLLPQQQNESEFAKYSNCIVVFSRTRNRMILNEKELVSALEKRYKAPVVIVRMETHTFEQQVNILQNAKMAIGLHGSILIMGMFLSPGSLLVELFPYAIPSENYTPYKTMANLPNMNIVYRAWENNFEANNVAYPDREILLGGIAHLNETEQRDILSTRWIPQHLCCINPYWLFRIYQDTIVNITDLFNTIDDGLREREKVLMRIATIDPIAQEIMPGRILKLRCEEATQDKLTISWDKPVNKAENVTYLVWVHQHYKEYETTDLKFTLTDIGNVHEFEFWIRPKKGDYIGQYSDKLVCLIEDG